MVVAKRNGTYLQSRHTVHSIVLFDSLAIASTDLPGSQAIGNSICAAVRLRGLAIDVSIAAEMNGGYIDRFLELKFRDSLPDEVISDRVL